MYTGKNIINDSMKVYSTTKNHVKQRASSLSRSSLCVGSYQEGNADTRRKVRRIIEKRICQEFHSQKPKCNGNLGRYNERSLYSRCLQVFCEGNPYA